MTCFAQILLHAAPALVLLSFAPCEVTSIHLDDANRITGGKDTQQTTTDAKADLCSGHIQSVLSRRPRNIIYRNITSESRGRACLRRQHGPYAEGDKTPTSYGKKRSVRGIGDFSQEGAHEHKAEAKALFRVKSCWKSPLKWISRSGIISSPNQW